MVSGVDLVAAQIRLALAGAWTGFPDPAPRGWALECRVCAEDPGLGFAPSTGRILALEVPREPWVRWDGGYDAGNEVTPHYDSLLGKLVCWGEDRAAATERAARALAHLVVLGPRTNVEFLRAVVEHPRFREGRLSTAFLEEEFASSWRRGATCDDATAALAAGAWLLLEGAGGGPRGSAAGAPSPWTSLPGWRAGGGHGP
jgi:acetyl/propionyl-CoA carboxylase alpha subunit